MFKKLQRKLTLTYSLWFFLTLATLFIILFFVFKNMIYQSVSWQVEDIARDQAIEFAHEHHLEGGHLRRSLYLSAYLSKSGKDIVYRGSMPDQLRNDLTTHIANEKTSGLIRVHESDGKPNLLIYAIAPVTENGRTNGFIAIAKGILGPHELIERWFWLLFLLSLLTGFLALLVAHFLARRAVLPMKRNYEKQKAFVADASHEMRTPLSVFSAGLEYIEAEDNRSLSDSSKETIADLKDEIRDMNTLISHLLTLAAADQELTQKRADFRLNQWLEPIVTYYAHRGQLEKKSFNSHWPHQPLNIHANPIEIKQLLMIFLDNAFNYTKQGDHISLQIESVAKDADLLFIIKDTGIGIPETEQQHIFERFYRVEKERARKNGGSGLGLSIAQKIIESYHGSISLDSGFHSGSVFKVVLPILKKRE
ncbi:HAMP domain-containing histidine kinase [Sporolactobacillus sp. CPB3-1]|uniref:histidine kinase n=1 Tax=Sporolactobacillus mangiferae TaxID=2940498 RepID=A0ABT0M679_9BACL|nr:HAMP domain-containing sensor histidine kinase [Sporolactobacillus mangiferae]MCL1630366.1 HAMP domain-containing histidine kinase [Sporolactobacillus mangiferae]